MTLKIQILGDFIPINQLNWTYVNTKSPGDSYSSSKITTIMATDAVSDSSVW